MTFNAVLEIIISLVALFWLMSTGCSFVIEALNSLLLNIRAKALERFVCEMVLGSNQVKQLRSFMRFWRRSNLEFTRGRRDPAAGTLAERLGLFSHGLVRALRKPQNIPGGHASPPSYIPARTFAQALLDRLMGLGWGLQAAAGPTRQMLDALDLPAPWRTRLEAAQQGASAGAPLLAAAAQLLGSVQDSTIGRARADLQSLIEPLNSATTNAALAALPQVPAMPGLPAIDSTPQGLRDLVVSMLKAADAAIAALAENQGAAESSKVSDLVAADALWMLAARKVGESMAHSPAVMDTLRALVQDAPLPASLREALRPMLAQANFDADKLRDALETWYDAVMERATGWFKRYTTLMLGLLGLAAAVGFNVNTLRIAQDLATDPELRHAGTAFAEFVVRERGRQQIAQQYRFHDREQSGRDWQGRMARLDGRQQLDACEANMHCELAALAEPMSRLLLTSGHLYGAARLVPMEEEPGEWRSEEGGERQDLTLRRLLCHATLAADPATARSPDLPKMAQGWDSNLNCAWIVEAFGKQGNKADDRRRFWSHPKVVWHTPLGSALVTALDGVRQPVDEETLNKRLKALREAYAAAQKEAAHVHGQAQGYLDRIPSLGRADGGPAFPGGPLLDIFGWLLTAVMVSFGASFWFDLLSNLVDRRATGPKPVPKAE